ncbi:MAG: RimK family alpha-L-glutamate ligase [Candidatus Woesearchaeota archaeon]
MMTDQKLHKPITVDDVLKTSSKKVLFTLAEDRVRSTENHFEIYYNTDERDSLHFAYSLMLKNYDVYFVNWHDFNGTGFSRMFSYNEQKFVEPVSINEIDIFFVYQFLEFSKDELSLKKFLSMVQVFENTGGLVINDPKTIRKNISKEYLIDLNRENVPSVKTYHLDENIIARMEAGEEFVIKPKVGEGGAGQIKTSEVTEIKEQIANKEHYIAQEYYPSGKNGEKSLVFLGDEFSHAVLKMPNPKKEDEYRSNESMGGTVSVYEPTEEEISFARSVLKVWRDWGYSVHYSRIDLIEINGKPHVIEAELMNPAAYANYSDIGPTFGERVAEYFDKLVYEHVQKTKLAKATLLNEEIEVAN